MSKNVLIALLLMALSVVVMILNRGTVSLDLVFGVVKPYASLVYLSFMSLGVVIGILLK
jgi:hypothetical protein